jgi:hypothetical protein
MYVIQLVLAHFKHRLLFYTLNSWQFYVPYSATHKALHFRPYTVFMCFVLFSKQTTFLSLQNTD